MPVEPGDLEGAPRLEAGRGKKEAAPVRHARPRLDQDAERGRVDELHAGEVDDQAIGRLGAALEQDVADRVRVVEIELARKAHDDGALDALDARDRILANAGRLLG